MAFRHISNVLADVMAGIESERAAVKVAQGIIDGPTCREDQISPPMLSAEGCASNAVKKAGAVEAPASHARGDVRQTAKREEIKAFTESLPVGRSIVTASPTVPHRKRRAPVSAVIIDLAIERAKRAHASTALRRVTL